MDCRQFIADIIASLAWPGVAIAFLLRFGPTLVGAVQRLAHVKYKDLELDFDKLRLQAEELQEDTTAEELPLKDPVIRSLEDQVLDAVERAPSAAILLAWSGLEAAIVAAVERLAVSAEPSYNRSLLRNIDMLKSHADLSPRHSVFMKAMWILRNRIAGNPESMQSVTQEQALSYAHNARDMIHHLETLKSG
jgi:hypothetical protein